jgi:predicted XRE-type DNA-binding protein
MTNQPRSPSSGLAQVVTICAPFQTPFRTTWATPSMLRKGAESTNLPRFSPDSVVLEPRNCKGFSRRYIPSRLHAALGWRCRCASRISEKIEVGPRDALSRHRDDQTKNPRSGRNRQREGIVKRKRYEVGSGNVFKDLGFPKPEEHLIKAQLVYKIHAILKNRRLKQSQAAALLGIKQPDVSKMLRGEFRQFSVERLLRFLVALDHDVQITIKPHRPGPAPAALHIS